MEVWRLSSLVFNVLLLALVVGVFAGELFAPAFVNTILVPGLPPQQRALTTSLTRIMLLQPLILGLGTILTAILHSKRQFFPSAIAVAIYDVGPIGGLLIARFIPGVGIYGPAFGLLATALLQVAVQIPPLVKQGVRYTFTWNLRNPGLREVMRLLGPNVLNVIVASAGAIVITYFASYLRDKTSIAVMHNAYMLFALPLALVGQTIGNALLPQLTIQATHHRYARMRWTVLKIVGAAVLLGVVAAILLFAFGKPAIRILFQYGAFSAHATALTSLALAGYAIGLPGQTASVLLALCFYAIKDVRTPLFANIFGLAVQIGASLLLLKVLKGNALILALPLAASISGIAQGLLLGLLLYIRLTAKAKTDRGMQRLRERRKRVSALQPSFGNLQPVAAFQPSFGNSQPVTAFQPSFGNPQPVAAFRPQFSNPRLVSAYRPPETDQSLVQAPEIQPVNAILLEISPRSSIASQTTQPEKFYTPAEEEQPTQPFVIEDRSVAHYQMTVLLDPGNLTALVQWHIAMMTSPGSERATILEVLTRICHQLRSEELSKYEIVTHAYNQAAITHPDNVDIYFSLGQIHQQSGNYVMAIAAYKRAMSNSATEVMARFSIAQCLLSLNRPLDAVQQLEEALQSLRHTSEVSIDPILWAARPRTEGKEHLAPEVEISMLLAHAYRLIGRQEDTQAVLHQVKQIISYQDAMPTTLTDFAVPQSSYNNHNTIPENTVDESNEAAQSVIQDSQPHDDLIRLYMDQGLLNEAIIELRDLAVIYFRNNQLQQAGATMRRIGKIHAEVGDLEEALIFLHHALEFIPNDINLLHEIVDFYCQLGHTQKAAYYQAEIARHYIDSHQIIDVHHIH